MTEPGRAPAARHVFGLTLIGTLLLQTAWMMSIPAFRGPDEFDHVYKAAAVSRGQLQTDGPAPHGRGGLVTVPLELVESASHACESRTYTGHDNCHPVDDETGDVVQVATAAGAYNPAWYAAIGVATRWVPGGVTDVAMRILSAVLSALLLAWAAAITAAWSRTRWPLLGLSVAATPTLIYSTVIAAPNGVNYAAGVLVWAAALGVARDTSGKHASRFLAPLVVGASIVAWTHTTGPMWLGLTAMVILLTRPVRWWAGTMRLRARTWLVAAVTTIAVTLAGVVWTRTAHTNSLGPADPTLPDFHIGLLLRGEFLWPFQTVGAFPMRNDPAPWPVYVIWFTTFLVLSGLAARRAGARARSAALVLVTALLVVPGVLTAIAFSSNGLAWQGRYALPLSVGMPLLAGWCLDRSALRLHARAGLWVGFALGIAQLSSVVHVAAQEMREYDVDPLAGRFTGGVELMAILAVAGTLVSTSLLSRRGAVTALEDARVPVSVA